MNVNSKSADGRGEAGSGFWTAVDRILERWSSPGSVALVFFAYGLLHAGLRLAFSATLPFDDALAEETLQRTFALAYQVRNPPLWEWLIHLLHGLAGPGLTAHLVLRYGLMVAIGLSLRAAVEEATGDRRTAAAAAYSLFAFYWFGWHFHEFVTHTLLLITACLVHLRLTLRWIKAPDGRTALLLALVTAVGLITKWNFTLYLALLVAAMALRPETRRRLFDARLLGILPASALTLGPVLTGISQLGGDVVAMSRSNLIGTKPYWERLAEGLGDAAANVPLFFMPWALLVGIALYGSRKVDGGPVVGFLLRFSVLAVSALVIGVAVLGVREIGTRYLYPIGLPMVVAALAVVAARGRGVRSGRIVAVAAPVLVVLVLAVRVTALASPGFTEKNRNRNYEPYAAVAMRLSEMGYGSAAFVTALHQESGNLIAALPDAMAGSAVTVRLMRPMSYAAERTCVLFWNAGYRTPGRPEPDLALPEALLALAPDAATRTAVDLEVPWAKTLLGSPRVGVYRLIDLGRNAEPCRQVFGPVTDR
ncbi:glycosyltransferase family 39 protein [Chthonobacter albigriseus]|uniref:glycosyltransferase family 39 protein n=1 Tax=Chthonobacter albigriseus TaxID=1683161 RepID=UPI0015EFB4D9|nr:glycosyltransferase family 39 protein [Chthonobacter albigriseus]